MRFSGTFERFEPAYSLLRLWLKDEDLGRRGESENHPVVRENSGASVHSLHVSALTLADICTRILQERVGESLQP